MARRSSPDSSLYLDRRKQRHGGILHGFHRIRWNYFGVIRVQKPMMPSLSCARFTRKRIMAIPSWIHKTGIQAITSWPPGDSAHPFSGNIRLCRYLSKRPF